MPTELRQWDFIVYADIHTHWFNEKAEVWSLLNVMAHDLGEVLPQTAFSIGIHPWFIPIDTQQQDILLQKVAQIASLPNVYAIGEIGYDKGTTIPSDVQINILKKQLFIAQQVQKPAILHWVGRWDLLLQIAENPMPTCVVHGFSKNATLARQLCQRGFYLSFGARLINASPSLIEAFNAVPETQFLLETDDQQNYQIEDIYKAAAHIKGWDLDRLKNQILTNIRLVVGG